MHLALALWVLGPALAVPCPQRQCSCWLAPVLCVSESRAQLSAQQPEDPALSSGARGLGNLAACPGSRQLALTPELYLLTAVPAVSQRQHCHCMYQLKCASLPSTPNILFSNNLLLVSINIFRLCGIRVVFWVWLCCSAVWHVGAVIWVRLCLPV